MKLAVMMTVIILCSGDIFVIFCDHPCFPLSIILTHFTHTHTHTHRTLVVGYGKVPSDTFSATVIITIIVGLGIPGALVIVGGIYVFIKKKPWQNASRMLAKARGRGGYTTLS